MRIRHALIMAAGRGVRMRPLTDEIPKAMAPLDGTTLVAAGIERIAAKVENIHVTVGHHKAMVAAHVIQHGASSAIDTEGHGNAWWLYNSFLSLVDEPVLVLTCDTAADIDIGLLEDEYRRHGAPACMLVPIAPVPGVDGDYLHLDGDAIVDVSRERRADVYCAGIQVLNPVRVRELAPPVEDFVAVWRALIPPRALRASRVHPDRWVSFDTTAQLAAGGRGA